MTLGKQGNENLAFVADQEFASAYGTLKKIEGFDEIAVKNNTLNSAESQETESSLYIDKKLTTKGLVLIISLATTIFASCSSWALIAPFFPRVAESKGLSINQYSWVFTIYEINKIFLPPFCAKLAIRMTPKVLLITSMFIIAWCATIFGFLTYAQNGTQFFVLCIIVRSFWSFGGAAGITCANIIGTLLFPKHIPTVYAAIEVGAGLGFIIGPFFGGYLFEWKGFAAPFLGTALLALLSTIPIIFLVKNELKPKDKTQDEKPTTIWRALKVPGVSVNLMISAVTCFSIGFNDSTLDYHLREIDNFSPSQVGQVFLITGFVYSICTFFYAKIAEKWANSYYLILLGCLLLFCCFVFLGPLYGLPLKPSLLNVIISQVFFGIGMGMCFVLSFDDCVKEAKKNLSDNDNTLATISGLYTSSYAFGNAVGPFVGGQLISRIGYRKTTVPMALVVVVATIIVSIYIFKVKRKPSSSASTIRTIAAS